MKHWSRKQMCKQYIQIVQVQKAKLEWPCICGKLATSKAHLQHLRTAKRNIIYLQQSWQQSACPLQRCKRMTSTKHKIFIQTIKQQFRQLISYLDSQVSQSSKNSQTLSTQQRQKIQNFKQFSHECPREMKLLILNLKSCNKLISC